MKKQTITSIELPEDSIYKLTKKRTLSSGYYPAVGVSHCVIGVLYPNKIQIGTSVSVGKGFSSNSLLTTPITKIRVLKHKVIFHTLNSVYELVEVNESENP
jgi:hypothetical protein